VMNWWSYFILNAEVQFFVFTRAGEDLVTYQHANIYWVTNSLRLWHLIIIIIRQLIRCHNMSIKCGYLYYPAPESWRRLNGATSWPASILHDIVSRPVASLLITGGRFYQISDPFVVWKLEFLVAGHSVD